MNSQTLDCNPIFQGKWNQSMILFMIEQRNVREVTYFMIAMSENQIVNNPRMKLKVIYMIMARM